MGGTDNKFMKLLVQSFTECLGSLPDAFFVLFSDRTSLDRVGMFLFIFLALGGVQSALYTSGANTLAFIQIAMCFGFGLAVAIFFAYRISGGALNPAVNFGLLVAGVMDPVTALAYTVAQMAGATAACGAVAGIFPGNSFKGANAVFAPTTIVQGFFLEMVLTFGLVITVLIMAVEKSRAAFYAPMIIGVYVFIAHLLAIPYTNTSINPARSFGASVITGIWTDHWVFWVAPLLGGAIAGGVYRFYKAVDYESLNPNQDATEKV
ncbi:hypothetical protein HDU82_006617 [Entophlyctis luteolus]|nr:hypothetical protein HDU82_006617 [Entophlyctis luteolus]